MRTDGSERELALLALEDTYINTLMETEIVEREFTQSIGNLSGDPSLETYNNVQFPNRHVDEPVPAPGIQPATFTLSNPFQESGMIITNDPVTTTVYELGVDYTVDGVNQTITTVVGGAITNLTDLFVTYFEPPVTLFSGDIAIPPNLKIESVVSNSGGASYPLLHVSENELLERRRSTPTMGNSRIYAMAGTGIMRLWPMPDVGDSITITYVPLPPMLSEADNRPAGLWDMAVFDLSQMDDFRGVESVPSLIPVQFHWNVLLPGTIVQMLDVDQRSNDSIFWQQRYEAGIAKMHLWHNTYGGDPTPIYNSSDSYLYTRPDQYMRGS